MNPPRITTRADARNTHTPHFILCLPERFLPLAGPAVVWAGLVRSVEVVVLPGEVHALASSSRWDGQVQFGNALLLARGGIVFRSFAKDRTSGGSRCEIPSTNARWEGKAQCSSLVNRGGE